MTSGYGKYVSMYMSIPCMVYQNIANAVCRLSGTGMFSPQNMMPPRSAQPPTQGGNDNDTDLDENILNDILQSLIFPSFTIDSVIVHLNCWRNFVERVLLVTPASLLSQLLLANYRKDPSD